MRTVFSSQSEVAHRWANQTQGYASSGPLSFRGVYAYSYNTPIARIHGINGHKVAIISDIFYSSTTCKHRSQLANAASHLTVLHSKSGVDSIEAVLLEHQDMYIEELMHSATSALRPDFRSVLARIDWFNELVSVLGFKHLELTVDKELISVGMEYQRFRDRKNKELDDTRDEKRRIREEQLAKEREIKINEALSDWLNGGMRNSVLSYMSPSFIRINENRVETTEGASVGLREANLLMDALLAGKNVKGTEINGYPVIGFDREQGIVKIGCHNISFDQAFKTLRGEK
jgi:hypothetical protein